MAEQEVAHYEMAGPGLLIEEAATSEPMAYMTPEEKLNWASLRGHIETRLSMMRSWRFSWIQHWALCAQYINPRRSLWLTNGGVDLPVANSMTRGLPINQNILDPTATYASRVCAAGMMAGLMSPSRPWFKLKPVGSVELDRDGQLWFEAVELMIYTVMAHSNFYDSGAQMFEDLTIYGTAPMIIYEDEDDIIRCYNPVVGEYFIGVGSTFRPETLYRQFTMNILQIVEMFGLDNCPEDVRSLWQNKGSYLETERIVAHAIEPNFEIDSPNGKAFGKIEGDFKYREVYWIWGSSTDFPLSKRGFKDAPFIAPRWWISANDPYGRSPAMDALGDIMQLQQETKRKAELLEKVVRPPLNAPIELKNQPSSILPGHITYSSNPGNGMKPVFEVRAEALPGITNDLMQIQGRIKTGFFNDLFLMLASSTKDMTAYEVAQRQNEKLQVLGPVIERFQNEGAGPAIKRVYSILARKKLLPPMPPSMQGMQIQIEYISMLALAQRAVATAGIERLLALQGKLAPVNPGVLDLIDDDEVMKEYGEQLGVSKKIFRPMEEVLKMRDAKAQQAAQAAQQQQMGHMATQIGPALTGAAKDLSATDVGGGMNALQAMLGGAGADIGGAGPSGGGQ